MRCIEMLKQLLMSKHAIRLTLTWDVLKWRYMTLMTWNVAD